MASICHCAKLTIQSRHQSADKGYEINAYHDAISTPEICAHSKGTTIDIRDLFSDLPVRRKFLKSPATELSYITEMVMQFALVHPDKDFTLISNGQEKINSKGLYKHEHLLVKFVGKNCLQALTPVQFSAGPITISGTITDPTFTFSNRSKQILSINKRLVKNGLIQKAIQDSFRDTIPQRRFPLICLDISVENSAIDVNVHPQKQDIKFINPGFLYDCLPKAISFALQEKNSHTNIVKPFVEASQPTVSHAASFSSGSTKHETVNSFQRLSEESGNTYEFPPVYKKLPSNKHIQSSMDLFKPLQSHKSTQQFSVVDFFQLYDTYIIVKTQQGLFIIDQHAVHERILYEKIKDNFAKQTARQVLLISETIQLSPELYTIFTSQLIYFESLNFIIEDFGNQQAIVREVPLHFAKANVAELVISICEQLKAFPNSHRDLTLDQKEVLQRQACRAAIKAGQKLSEPEIKQLLQDFIDSPQNFTCPHGRPLFIHYDQSRLESLFLRN